MQIAPLSAHAPKLWVWRGNARLMQIASPYARALNADYPVTRGAAGFAESRIKALSVSELVVELRKKGLTYEEVFLEAASA